MWHSVSAVFLALAVGVTADIAIFDLTHTLTMNPQDAYETVHTVSCLSGIVNRQQPSLWVNYTAIDPYWLQYTRQEGWLTNETFTPVTSVADLVARFSASLAGVVLYDTSVPATSNLGSTAAGARSLLPVAYRDAPGSMYDVIVKAGLLQVQLNLVGKFNGNVTGSAKNDAYRWAITEFLLSKESNAAFSAYFIDYWWTYPGVYSKSNDYTVNTVSNHDYLVSKQAFFWDLDTWDDEAPNDDPNQPVGTDYATFLAIFAAANTVLQGSSMITVSGFTPWLFKYVDAKHGGVPTEWQTAMVLSQYNAVLDADACCVDGMANAAFFQHFPLSSRYVQNPPPLPADLVKAGYMNADGTVVPYNYIAFYVGDYDSASWLYSQFPLKWNDVARGAVPLSWAVDPNLSRRFPPVFHLIFSSLAAGDVVTTGDSGAGYLNPTGLFNRPISKLPPGDQLWRTHCTNLYNQFGITYTGFLINGASGGLTDEALDLYKWFSWDGFTEQTGYAPDGKTPPYLQGNTPLFNEWDLSGNVPNDAGTILSRYKSGLQFNVYRTVLQPASYHKQVVDTVTGKNSNIKFVNAITLSYLTRAAQGGNNNDRVSYVDDNIPLEMNAGSTLLFQFTVRNNGWNTLSCGPTAPNATRVMLQYGMGPANGVAFATTDLTPGNSAVFTGHFEVPSAKGGYLLAYQLRRGWEDTGDFDNLGNPAWYLNINVV